jgi:hypothetical protein
MDLYTYTVEDFIITDTRALHNDTLKLSYSAYVNGDAVANRLISLGDSTAPSTTSRLTKVPVWPML